MIESFITHPILRQFHENISENFENFKSVIKEKNQELVNSFNSECKNFPQELL